jgi:hypothetical protein
LEAKCSYLFLSHSLLPLLPPLKPYLLVLNSSSPVRTISYSQRQFMRGQRQFTRGQRQFTRGSLLQTALQMNVRHGSTMAAEGFSGASTGDGGGAWMGLDLRQEVVVAGVCPNGGHGEGVVAALERFGLVYDVFGCVRWFERAWWCWMGLI